MKRYVIATGTVTYAIKGRDILRKNGFSVKIERITGDKTLGCGYVLIISEKVSEAEKILKNNGVKILKIAEEQ
ncbi:MAG: DUF3343 domain-containing protein [Clostridia bacterium]|nr:DUF3343 domain-containing protein [Clostridia bacterium]